MGSRVVDVTTVAGVREQRRVRSCFAACLLLCSLVAALRWTEKPLLSACCVAAALLCLAPIPPANNDESSITFGKTRFGPIFDPFLVPKWPIFKAFWEFP